MTELDNFFNLSNDYFSLSCKKCTFRIEETLKTNGQPHKILTVYPVNNEIINYAFSGSQGLCLTTPHGSLQNKNVLGSLISLPATNVKKTAAKKGKVEEPKPEAPEEKALTLEDVRAVCADKSRSGFTAEVKEILSKHGVEKLSEVNPAEYKALLAEVEVLGNAG